MVEMLDNELIINQQETGFKIKSPLLEFTRKLQE